MKKTKPIQNPLEKHANHNVVIRSVRNQHLAKYHCVDCNKFVAWVGYQAAIRAWELGLFEEQQKRAPRTGAPDKETLCHKGPSQ